VEYDSMYNEDSKTPTYAVKSMASTWTCHRMQGMIMGNGVMYLWNSGGPICGWLIS
jgi:hypothetical protein